MAIGFAPAAEFMLASGNVARGRALLEELEQASGTREDPYYTAVLPELVRCALALGDPALAARLIAGVEPRTPLQQHALVTCRAALAEAAGDQAAATIYADAATRWRQFGDVPELAYALLGEGRCMLNLGLPEAERPLREARDLFTAMSYAPAVSETEALLQRPIARTS